MSTLYVDTINEKTSGNGVLIPGHVVQVVSTSTLGLPSTTSSSYVASGVSLSITPTSASNKILVLFSGGAQNIVSTGGFKVAVYRGGSSVYEASLVQFTNSGGNSVSGYLVQYLDSPATTSSVTYEQYFAAYNAGTAYLNNGQITLMEIAQ